MRRSAIAAPVLPGKDAATIGQTFKANLAEYQESRRRAGVTLERAYSMETPMGTFVTGYVEGENDFPTTLATFAQSDLEIDRYFIQALKEIHGLDLSQPGTPPELLAEWFDPDVTERRPGLAFCVPVIPGQTDAGRAFARTAYYDRVTELAASRRALGANGEVVVLNSTPQGDLICVYTEAEHPVEGNRGFAASTSPYDLWFKAELKKLFPPSVDFDQPLPVINTIWDWHLTTVRV